MSIHLGRHLALATCLSLVVASIADAAPKRKIVDAVEDDEEEDADDEDEDGEDEDAEDEDAEEDEEESARGKRKSRHKRARSAVADDDSDEVDAPASVSKRASTGKRDWRFAFGPNVWAASVDASVAVGDKSVGTAVEFMQLSRYTRYGVPLVAEVRYKRFSLVTDFLYAVVDIAGGNQVGPLMVTLQGTVSSLLVDSMAGYRFLGDDESPVSLEGRAGIRYQSTAISGSIGVGGSGFTAPEIVDAGGDLLAGARVVMRPFSRLHVTGTIDQSVAGSSTSTWSAGAEANVRVASWFQVDVGWRTLTQQRAAISTVMYGPRVALQILF